MTEQELANAFRALGNENRLAIFLQILEAERKSYKRECPCVVTDVISKMGIGAPTISHHLKELANAGLIETERDGKFLVARVNREVLAEMRTRLELGIKTQSGRKS
jgi:DNA-binding transcriptional ArsR family regulator